MAAIASRTSGSSSTIRTSAAILTRTRFAAPRRAVACPRLISFGCCSMERPERWEGERNGSAARRAVAQRQAAAVLLHDPLHDREPQTGPGRAHGNVRLGEALGRLGQSAAIVLHLDQATLRSLDELDCDPAWGLVALLPLHPLEYRLNRVLQQVGQSLRHLLGITIQLNVAFWKPCFETDLGTGALLEINSLTDQILP